MYIFSDERCTVVHLIDRYENHIKERNLPLLLYEAIISINKCLNKQEIIRKAKENVLNKFNAVKMAQQYLNIAINEK